MNILSKAINNTIGAINYASASAYTSSTDMADSIHTKLTEYGDSMADGLVKNDATNDGYMMQTAHINFLNTLRKQKPDVYKDLVQVGEIMEATSDVSAAKNIVATFFGIVATDLPLVSDESASASALPPNLRYKFQ